MRGLKGPSKVFVVAMTAATLALMAAVGLSAASGTFGSTKVVASVVTLFSSNSVRNDSQGDDHHKCKGDDEEHKEATPGHEHHPCDDGGGGD
jgi:hypothetical protein